MLVGSIDTTATCVAKIVAVIGGDRTLAAGIAADVDNPARLRGWCWEALRRWPHNPIVLRRAAVDTEIAGVAVRADDQIYIYTQAAMLDPSVFPDPQVANPTRPLRPYLHFGGGLQDGAWHHVRSYLPERAGRSETVALWRKIRTVEDPRWTERYHTRDPSRLAFGGRISIRMGDGSVVADELAVANAHPLGAAPWVRSDYVGKFRTLTEGLIEPAEADRFLSAAERLKALRPDELGGLTVALPAGRPAQGRPGIF